MPRQGRFLHQVLRSPYHDASFLSSCRQRYLRFLALAATQPPGAPMLVPMYDIDLMWHSHMALSGAYADDCEALLPPGRSPLGHDDALSHAALQDPFAATLERYEACTGLVYNVAPTRRLPSSVAHPLVMPLWPLAAALCDPRVTTLLSPRELAAELAEEGALLRGRGRSQGRPSSSSASASSGAGIRHDGGTGGRGARPPMRGSPDHLSRNGAFALYALWCLAEALQAAEAEQGRLEGPRLPHSQSQPAPEPRPPRKAAAAAAAGSRGPGGGGGGAGGVWRRLSGCLPGTGRGGGGGAGCHSQAAVDAAVRHMTTQLLRLADLGDPNSPLASCHHRFFEDLLPLPPQPQALHTDGGVADTTTYGHRHHHHPAPSPPLDLPAAGHAAPAARNAPGVYLAPHHYATPAPVYYSPSDFCLLGRGRWCLPPALAEEVLEHVAVSYDAPSDALFAGEGNDGGGGDPNGGARFNSLGAIVHSADWRRRMVSCYRTLYKQLQRRAAAA